MFSTKLNPDLISRLETDTVFAAEASELGWPPGKRPYNFVVYGETFRIHDTEYDNDGDVTRWIYYCRVMGKFAQIFND